MEILTLDIETRPNLAFVWQLFNQNINLGSLVSSAEVICFAAKWYHDPEIIFSSVFHDGREEMAERAWNLLDEADAIIHYNGKQFDIPHLNTIFLDYENTAKPPSPHKGIDLLEVVKRKFAFPSNKLEYVAKRLGVGAKAQTGGMETWIKCMADDPVAWETMKKYNIQDVRVTEKLYEKLLPHIDGHPSWAAFSSENVCANCGSDNLIREGFAFLKTGAYQRYSCGTCGHWMRDTKRVDKTEVTEVIS